MRYKRPKLGERSGWAKSVPCRTLKPDDLFLFKQRAADREGNRFVADDVVCRATQSGGYVIAGTVGGKRFKFDENDRVKILKPRA